jgi:hypothetical protein
MKKKKVVRLTEQDLVNLIKQMIGGMAGVSLDDTGKASVSTDSTSTTSNTNQSLSSPGKPSDFGKAVDKIIDEFEGGYYHPDMLKDGRVKDSRYGGSGETMFGMDRKTGKQELTSAGKEFWDLIDKENARKNWKWNYMLKDNPTLAGRLKGLIGQIMEPLFNQYMDKYLTSEAREIVKNNPKLFFNFAYATFNGPGWFERFAKIINNEVSKGNKDPESLVDIDIMNRKNSNSTLIAQGGKKLDKISDTLA